MSPRQVASTARLLATTAAIGELASIAIRNASSTSERPFVESTLFSDAPRVVNACARISSSSSDSAMVSASFAILIASSFSFASIRRRADIARTRAFAVDGLRLGHELECTRHVAVGLVAAPPVPRTLRQQRLGLPGRLAIAPFEQRVPSFDQSLVTSFRCGEMEGPCSPEEELGVVGIVRRGQRERRREVLRGGSMCVERERPVPGLAERVARSLRNRRVIASRGASQFQGGGPVVGEHLGVVFGTAERLDPLGDTAVLRSPVRAGNLTVGDVANERMGEGELALALDGGAPLATDESLSLERVQAPARHHHRSARATRARTPSRPLLRRARGSFPSPRVRRAGRR